MGYKYCSKDIIVEKGIDRATGETITEEQWGIHDMHKVWNANNQCPYFKVPHIFYTKKKQAQTEAITVKYCKDCHYWSYMPDWDD